MTNTRMTPHDQKVRSLASDYSTKGYVVVVNPQPSELPVDLAGYQPDLIATRGTETVIVEVKTSANRLPIDRYRAIADRIAAHDGWRFILVTLDEPNQFDPPALPATLPDWREIRQKFLAVNTMVQQGLLEPAVLYLWSVVEVALRKRAESARIPVERFPNTRLLRHLYSFGEISVHEFDDLQTTLAYRDRVARGLTTVIDAAFVNKATTMVGNLLTKWAA